MSADGVSATPDEPAAPTTATDAAARKPRGPEVILVSDARKCTAAVAAEVPNQCDTKLWVVGRTPEGKYVSPARVTVERRLFLLQSVPDGLVKGEFKLPRWGKFSALKKPDGAPVVKGVDCFEAPPMRRRRRRADDSTAGPGCAAQVFVGDVFKLPTFLRAAEASSVDTDAKATSTSTAATKTKRSDPKPVVDSSEVCSSMPRPARRGLAQALERCADVILYDLAPLAEEILLGKLEELRRDGAPNWDRVATTGLLKNLRAAFDGFRKLEVRDGEALLQRLRQLDADAHELSQARQRVHAARRHLSNPDLVLGSLEDGQTLIAYVRRLSNLPELDAAALPNNARPLRDVLDAVRRIVEAKMRYSALSKGDAIQAKILAKNGEDYCAGVVNSMSGSRSGTVNEEALVHRLELMCYKKILSGDLGEVYSICLAGDGGTGTAPGSKPVGGQAWAIHVGVSTDVRELFPKKTCGYAQKQLADEEKDARWRMMSKVEREPYKTAGKAYNASKPEQTEKYLADKKWWNEKQQNYTKCSRAMLNPHQPTLRQSRSAVELMVADERVRENQTLPAFAPPRRRRTGKSVVMTISRRLTMKHVKLLLTSGTVPLLGRGLGPGDVTLQINGVVLADNMKVADLCNAVTLHAHRRGKARRRGGRQRIIPWLDKADIAVVTMPLGLTFGGDGKKATTLAKKAREALALVGLTVAACSSRDGGEAAYLGLLKPEECMDVRFESYMLAAAYIWANKGLLMVAIVLSLGLGEDASTSTRDLLLKLRALRDEGASRCYYLLSKPEFLLHTSVLAALNYAVVHASLKWGHTYGGFRFNELGTHVMNLVAKYVAVAIDPKASGLFDDAYAYAKPLGFEHAVDNLAKNYTKELIEYIINRYDYVLCLPWSHSFFFDKDRRAPYARALGRQLWPPRVGGRRGAEPRPDGRRRALAALHQGAGARQPRGDPRPAPVRRCGTPWTWSRRGEPGGIAAGGELPSILYEALAKKFCSYKVDNAHSGSWSRS
ncbi:hypothetical protein JL720_7786 [Aureococcus anophagefferens]|nr:hypothetical protein JL720_7786 [Aureococcus anophagefferens]